MPESVEYQRHDNKRQPHQALVQNLGGKKPSRRFKDARWTSASRLFDVNFSEDEIEELRDEIEELQEKLESYQNEVITMTEENERFIRLEDNIQQLNNRVGSVEGDIKQINTKLDGLERIENKLDNLPDESKVESIFDKQIKDKHIATRTFVGLSVASSTIIILGYLIRFVM